MDYTDLDLYWWNDVAPAFTGHALRELRRDAMRDSHLRIARQALLKLMFICLNAFTGASET